MSERSYTTVDKSSWGNGPWSNEPDKLQWIDEATNLDCLIVRGPMGALCGYVGVPPEHPWHKREYGGDGWEDTTAPDNTIDVHGGLTYSDLCAEDSPEDTGICHVPPPGRAPDVWWFGFDCAHSGDACPALVARERERGETPISWPVPQRYRDLSYVRREVASLAAQLKAVPA